MLTFIDGGVTAAQGFTASGVHCGIRKNRSKKDLALIVSDREAAAAAVYTRNLVKGAPNTVTARHIADGKARAILCNSGIANTCAFDGIEKATAMCALAADALHRARDEPLRRAHAVVEVAQLFQEQPLLFISLPAPGAVLHVLLHRLPLQLRQAAVQVTV